MSPYRTACPTILQKKQNDNFYEKNFPLPPAFGRRQGKKKKREGEGKGRGHGGGVARALGGLPFPFPFPFLFLAAGQRPAATSYFVKLCYPIPLVGYKEAAS